MKHYLKTKKNFVIICTERPRQEFLSLSTATGWYDYYTKISDKADMMSQMMIPPGLDSLSPDAPPMADGLLGLLRCASGTGTMILTIISALEKLFPDIQERTSLKLHFIGADFREAAGLMVFEEILHLLPSLKHLQVNFIGPDLPKETIVEVAKRGSINLMNLDCCPECTPAGRTRSLSLWQGTYHDYVKSDAFEKPDLAVAFQYVFPKHLYPTLNILQAVTRSTSNSKLFTGPDFHKNINWIGCPLSIVFQRPHIQRCSHVIMRLRCEKKLKY
jgi:splicing suppressor protein 51